MNNRLGVKKAIRAMGEPIRRQYRAKKRVLLSRVFVYVKKRGYVDRSQKEQKELRDMW